MSKAKQPNPDDKLNPDEVASAWNITKKTLYNWRSDQDHDAPKGFRIGRSLWWLRSDVDGYLELKQNAA